MDWLNTLEEAINHKQSFFKKINIPRIGYILITKYPYARPEIMVIRTNEPYCKEVLTFKKSNLSAFDAYDLVREWEAYLKEKYQ